jgi:hypothetical protein
MSHESKAIKEIHEIRLRNYEATKNMSRSELVSYMNEKGKQATERLGLQSKHGKFLRLFASTPISQLL